MTGGGVVVSACLRQANGSGYIYVVRVQVGGRVVTVTIDAATGAPR